MKDVEDPVFFDIEPIDRFHMRPDPADRTPSIQIIGNQTCILRTSGNGGFCSMVGKKSNIDYREKVVA